MSKSTTAIELCALAVGLAGCNAELTDIDSLGSAIEVAPLPPGLREHIFVDGPPTGNGSHLGTCLVTTNDQIDAHLLAGWHIPATGYVYRVNPSTFPSSVSAEGRAAIAASFAAWNGADPDKLFVDGGDTSVKVSKLDGINLIAFGTLQNGVLAVTRTWYNSSTGEAVESDMIFSKRYPWANFPDGGGECQSSPDAVDMQNIGTHEAGHVIGLDHPPDSVGGVSTQDLTMYRFGSGGELKRRTPGVGDIIGANEVAP